MHKKKPIIFFKKKGKRKLTLICVGNPSHRQPQPAASSSSSHHVRISAASPSRSRGAPPIRRPSPRQPSRLSRGLRSCTAQPLAAEPSDAAYPSRGVPSEMHATCDRSQSSFSTQVTPPPDPSVQSLCATTQSERPAAPHRHPRPLHTAPACKPHRIHPQAAPAPFSTSRFPAEPRLPPAASQAKSCFRAESVRLSLSRQPTPVLCTYFGKSIGFSADPAKA